MSKLDELLDKVEDKAKDIIELCEYEHMPYLLFFKHSIIMAKIIRLQNEALKDVIRNSSDILAKKRCSLALDETEKLVEGL